MSTGEPVSNVLVELDITEVNSGGINSAFVPFLETYTDSNGKFSFEFESRNFVKFRLKYTKDGYHISSNEFEPEDLVADYVINDPIPQESYIHIRVLNLIPYNIEDELKIRLLGIDIDCSVCSGADYRYFYGDLVDTAFLCTVVGGDNVTISKISIHNGESTMSDSQVYCTPGDTVFYNCYY